MSDKCTHDTSIEKFSIGRLIVSRCTWGCGELLISILDDNGMTTTRTVNEIEAAAQRLEDAERVIAPFAKVGELYLPVDKTDDSPFLNVDDAVVLRGIFNSHVGDGITVGVFRAAAKWTEQK
jgi:hypothetical protein